MSDELGHIVREAWVAYCIETGRTERPDHIAPWEQMDEWSKEVDRRIGTAVAEHVGAKLRAELADARAALERVNWVNDYCLWCKRFYDDGHASDCVRQIGLGLAKKPESRK